MGFLRSIGAVVGGFAAMTLIVMVTTPVAARLLGADVAGAGLTTAYLVANLGLSAVAAVVGGLLAAGLAPRRPVMHALYLAGAVLGIGVLSILLVDVPEAGQPEWYPAVAVCVGFVGVMLGGCLRSRRSGDG